MQFYQYTLPSGAQLTGYLRDACPEMPNYTERPAVLILPGGGYAYCSKREADPVAMQFLQAGYQVFVLIYTTDHAPLNWKPLIDAAGAIIHLRQKAGELHILPNKIAVAGFSAGGHLACSTALLWQEAPVQSALNNAGKQACPDAVILGYPVITSGPYAHRGSFDMLTGTDEELCGAMSLETRVQPGLPPFFLWHTVEDADVPVENSLLLATALQKNKVPYELHLFAHGSHGSSICTSEVNTPNRHNAVWVDLCTDWLGDVFDFHA